MSLLKIETTNFGYRSIKDADARGSYLRQAEFLSKMIRWEVEAGRLTPYDASREANQIRNAIMETTRIESSEVGRAIAEAKKKYGRSLDSLESKYAKEIFSQEFSALNAVERNSVWLEIVNSSGRPDPRVSSNVSSYGRVGRGLVFASLAVSVYNVATAEDTGRQIVKEGVTTGAGVLGGMAGGALAGLACGPASPICVTVGVFVGGVIAALGADAGFDWVW